jgi:MFS family permease
VFAATVVVWTIGEMVHVPTNAAATARLAPEHARGRYQGVMGMSWAVAGFVAPLLAGWIVDGPGPDVLWIGCAVVGAVAAVGYTVLLRRALAEHDGPGAGAVKTDAGKTDAVKTDAVLKDVQGAARKDAGQSQAAPVTVEKAEPIGG